jgi:molybdopterin/thiamine biosynthesis adenylyltransferase
MNIPKNFLEEFLSRTIVFAKYNFTSKCEDKQYIETLTSARVAITGNKEVLSTYNGQHMLLMSLNLLSRFCINIDLIIPNDIKINTKSPQLDGYNLLASLLDLAKNINPQININHFEDTENRYDCVIAIGDYYRSYGKTISINSDGWISFIDTEGNSFSWTSDNNNPIGAYASACFGVAELFKIIFKRIKNIPRIGSQIFSSFDYGFQKNSSANPSLPSDIKIENLHFVSMGAINSSVLYTLCSIPGLKASAKITEPESLDFSNLNRYIFSTFIEANNQVSKIDSAKDFSHGKVNIINDDPFLIEDNKESIQEHDIVIVGVDNNEGRWEVQKCNPKFLICGGTNENGLARVTRHPRGNDEYCLRCEYTEPSIVSDTPEPTISFVSVLAGVLLTAEIIKSYTKEYEDYQLKNFFEIDVLRSPYITKDSLRTNCLIALFINEFGYGIPLFSKIK